MMYKCFGVRNTGILILITLVLKLTIATGHAALIASADISSCDGSDISGKVFFVELPSEQGVKVVLVSAWTQGLSPGQHAVHVHETANCTPCSAANGHFDPGPHANPNPDANHPFHSGDLVNMKVGATGIGILRTATSRLTLSPGPLSINDNDGSALIIHVDPDTYCPNGDVAGCAGGGRAACGIITLN